MVGHVEELRIYLVCGAGGLVRVLRREFGALTARMTKDRPVVPVLREAVAAARAVTVGVVREGLTRVLLEDYFLQYVSNAFGERILGIATDSFLDCQRILQISHRRRYAFVTYVRKLHVDLASMSDLMQPEQLREDMF